MSVFISQVNYWHLILGEDIPEADDAQGSNDLLVYDTACKSLYPGDMRHILSLHFPQLANS